MSTGFYKTARVVVLFFMAIMAAAVCAQKPANFAENVHSLLKHTVPLIAPHELRAQLTGSTPPVLLDTREIEEFRVSHIRGARHVGYKEFKTGSITDIPKDAAIVVYCSLGVRSEEIGEKLRKAGCKNVKNLFGGLFGWVNRDGPVYDMNGQPSQRVHAFSPKWGKWLFKGEKVY